MPRSTEFVAFALHVKLWLHFESTAHGCKHMQRVGPQRNFSVSSDPQASSHLAACSTRRHTTGMSLVPTMLIGRAPFFRCPALHSMGVSCPLQELSFKEFRMTTPPPLCHKNSNNSPRQASPSQHQCNSNSNTNTKAIFRVSS